MIKNCKIKSSGFTLLEILLVIGIIAILAGIVIVAINPSKQLAQVRNSQRKSDIKQVANAITQFYIDHSYFPASTTFSTITLMTICPTGASSSPAAGFNCTGMLNLSELVPNYLVSIPSDPATTTTAGYSVMLINKQPAVSAPLAELGTPIAIGNVALSWAPISGLLAHWKMNDNAASTAVVDNTGSYGGTATQRNTSAMTTSGKIGTALTFANNEYISAGTISLPGDFTVNQWVKTSSVLVNSFTFRGGSYPTDVFDIGWSTAVTGYFGGCSYPANRVMIDLTPTNYADGNWHMITVTLNTTTKVLTVFMDGASFVNNSVAVSGTGVMCNSGTTGTQIGAMARGGWYFNGGSIDDTRVYNKVLSSTEISALYNGGAGTEAE